MLIYPNSQKYTISLRKEDTNMREYITPEMKTLAFISEEAIGAPLEPTTSNGQTTNDGELEWFATL